MFPESAGHANSDPIQCPLSRVVLWKAGRSPHPAVHHGQRNANFVGQSAPPVSRDESPLWVIFAMFQVIEHFPFHALRRASAAGIVLLREEPELVSVGIPTALHHSAVRLAGSFRPAWSCPKRSHSSHRVPGSGTVPLRPYRSDSARAGGRCPVPDNFDLGRPSWRSAASHRDPANDA